jgi:hypothetical protein
MEQNPSGNLACDSFDSLLATLGMKRKMSGTRLVTDLVNSTTGKRFPGGNKMNSQKSSQVKKLNFTKISNDSMKKIKAGEPGVIQRGA